MLNAVRMGPLLTSPASRVSSFQAHLREPDNAVRGADGHTGQRLVALRLADSQCANAHKSLP
jgi:hypothetical protein